jgi:hypothetical protein
MARGQANIESRPSGTHVISARLPAPLAEELLAEVSRTGARLSDLVRQAVEAFLGRSCTAGLSVTCTGSLRVGPFPGQYATVNANLVVEQVAVMVT